MGVIRTFACLLTTASLLTLTAIARPQGKKKEPPIGQTINGQKLQYQSYRSGGQRYYRVRSCAGEIRTEVKWKDKDELLLGAILPKCPNKTGPCDWFTTSTPTEKTRTAKTLFGYGVNGDQFKVEPDAICREVEKEKTSARKLISSIDGTVADALDNPIVLNFSVSSNVIVADGKPKLVHAIRVGKSNAAPLALDKELNPNKHPVLVWDSIEPGEFSKAVSAKQAYAVDAKTEFTFETPAPDYRVEWKLVKVMVGKDVVAATTAPAYVAGKSRKGKE